LLARELKYPEIFFLPTFGERLAQRTGLFTCQELKVKDSSQSPLWRSLLNFPQFKHAEPKSFEVNSLAKVRVYEPKQNQVVVQILAGNTTNVVHPILQATVTGVDVLNLEYP